MYGSCVVQMWWSRTASFRATATTALFRACLPLTRQIEYGPEVLGSLLRLASLGLVNEQFMRPDPNTSDQQKLASLLRLGTRRVFQLSPFGERFMLFVASHPAPMEVSDQA
jgi:hypothetical protein